MQKQREWRCSECGMLLGVLKQDRVRIRFGRTHEYIASLPVTCTCKRCHTLHELSSAASGPGITATRNVAFRKA